MTNYRISIAVLFFLVISSLSLNAQNEKISAFGEYEGYNIERTSKMKYNSHYIEVDHKVKLATDVFLPKDIKDGEQLPTVLYLTRYIRSLRAKWFIKWLKNPIFGQVSEKEVKFWTSHGYAVVLVDVRGTGSSTGVRPMEFSPAEIKDGKHVVDWIIKQKWSNGKVGSTGVSYLGTTAELLLVNQHPAVKACIPRSNIFDLYNDIAYPGGIPHKAFIEVWRDLTLNLDTANFEIVSKQAKRLIKSASRVKGDKRKRNYKQAMEDHSNNFDIFKALFEIEFKDEIHPTLSKPITAYSISNYIDEISHSGTAIYRIDGWWDGGLSKSAVYGYLTTPNTKRLTIGPWDHGPAQNVSPFNESAEVTFNIKAEMLRFFDHYIKGIDNGIQNEPPVNYFTFGEEKWKTSDQWPPKEIEYHDVFLSENGELVFKESDVKAGSKTYDVDYTVGTGDAAGWNSMTENYRFGGPISYPDRAEVNKKMTVFKTTPLQEATEITGHVIVDLYMSISEKDGGVFVYLEEVSPEGFVQYITEGELRVVHRKVADKNDRLLPYIGPYHSCMKSDTLWAVSNEVFQLSLEMHPTSYEVPEGHSLQLSIAGSDVNHFALTKIQPEEMTFYFTEEHPSKVLIPIIED